MKNKVYYIKLYFQKQNVFERDILSFLDSLNKIKNLHFFYVLLNKSGLEIVEKMKKIQENNEYKYCGHPIISNEEERKLIRKTSNGNDRVLLIIAQNFEHVKKVIDRIIQKNKKSFSKIDREKIEIQKVDIVTPLNLRGDADILKLSFLLSKYAIQLLNMKKGLNLKSLPSLFLSFSLILDLAKVLNEQDAIAGMIKNYHEYLLDYFRFSRAEILSLNRASRKYFELIRKIYKKSFQFQKTRWYLDLIDELRQVITRGNLFRKINKKFIVAKPYWMFFHWFNNSLNIHFAQEVVLVFILKNFYESEK